MNKKPIRDIQDRVVSVLRGEKPDRLPFIDRLELWYASRARSGSVPSEFMGRTTSPNVHSDLVAFPTDFEGMALPDLHRAVGMGEQLMMMVHGRRFRGSELTITLDGETVYQAVDPVVKWIPRLYDLLPLDAPGETVVQFITPVGRLTMRNALTPEMVQSSTVPIMTEHPIKDESDYRVLKYLLEHSEFVPQYQAVAEEQSKMGEIGFVVPLLSRIPFQHAYLSWVGEVQTIYMMADDPHLFNRILGLLDELLLDDIAKLSDFTWPYIQFPDNLDGMVTSPKLFREYCLPCYQRYIDLLHTQGKKVGSHTDGSIRPLLDLLAESGLDVCESFSPAPLTDCTFEEAWSAWQGGPIIWGGIPSLILREETSESEFREYVRGLLRTVGNGPIILGVGDMVMGDNLIERVRYIAERVEEHAVA